MKDISMLSASERAVILAKRAYYKKWRAKNKDKIQEYQKRYWVKKAQELSANVETTTDQITKEVKL